MSLFDPIPMTRLVIVTNPVSVIRVVLSIGLLLIFVFEAKNRVFRLVLFLLVLAMLNLFGCASRKEAFLEKSYPECRVSKDEYTLVCPLPKELRSKCNANPEDPQCLR